MGILRHDHFFSRICSQPSGPSTGNAQAAGRIVLWPNPLRLLYQNGRPIGPARRKSGVQTGKGRFGFWFNIRSMPFYGIAAKRRPKTAKLFSLRLLYHIRNRKSGFNAAPAAEPGRSRVDMV